MKRILQKTLPEPALACARWVRDIARETPEGRVVRWLKQKNYSDLPLLGPTEAAIGLVAARAAEIYGGSWNYQSDALRREVALVFETSVRRLSESHPTINYLEIGSCQGLSMSLIGTLLGRGGVRGSLTSIDPYFSDGYVEQGNRVVVDKVTKERAHQLYSALALDVEQIEEVSAVGLRRLMSGRKQAHLVYIDGSHEGMNPLRDLALSLELLAGDGIVMLDDHRTYRDVKILKELCDREFIKVAESWKVAAYEVRGTWG